MEILHAHIMYGAWAKVYEAAKALPIASSSGTGAGAGAGAGSGAGVTDVAQLCRWVLFPLCLSVSSLCLCACLPCVIVLCVMAVSAMAVPWLCLGCALVVPWLCHDRVRSDRHHLSMDSHALDLMESNLKGRVHDVVVCLTAALSNANFIPVAFAKAGEPDPGVVFSLIELPVCWVSLGPLIPLSPPPLPPPMMWLHLALGCCRLCIRFCSSLSCAFCCSLTLLYP